VAPLRQPLGIKLVCDFGEFGISKQGSIMDEDHVIQISASASNETLDQGLDISLDSLSHMIMLMSLEVELRALVREMNSAKSLMARSKSF
jgi:hypothetical protein